MILPAILEAIAEMRRHPLRTFLTIFGVMVAISTVVAVASLLGSAQNLIHKILSETVGVRTLSVAYREGQRVNGRWVPARRANPLSVEDAAAIATTFASEVDAVSAVELFHASVSRIDTALATQARAVEPDYFRLFNRRLLAGRLFDARDLDNAAAVVIVSGYAARSLFGTEDPLGGEVRLDDLRMRVVGVVADTAVSQGRQIEVFLPVSTARVRFPDRGHSRVVFLQAAEGTEPATLATSVRELVVRRHRGYDANDFEVQTDEDTQNDVQYGLLLVTIVFSLIAALCLITGVVGIMNVLLAAVTERTREIGVRRAVGATSRNILAQFLVESLCLTGVGGIGGLAAGYFVAFVLGYVVTLFLSGGGNAPFRLTPSMSPVVVAVAVVTSSVVGIVFGLYPAVRASNMNPVEALRYE